MTLVYFRDGSISHVLSSSPTGTSLCGRSAWPDDWLREVDKARSMPLCVSCGALVKAAA